MTTATLGGEIDVPTIGGKKAKVKIPGGTQTGQQFRLKEKGMPVVQSDSKGDMYIEIFVETPVNLNNKQKDLFKKLDEDLSGKDGKKHSPESSGFVNRMKDLWTDLTE
jgi:molecular chaperone DnaJ